MLEITVVYFNYDILSVSVLRKQQVNQSDARPSDKCLALCSLFWLERHFIEAVKYDSINHVANMLA